MKKETQNHTWDESQEDSGEWQTEVTENEDAHSHKTAPEETNLFGGAAIPEREKAIQNDEDRKLRSESYKVLAHLGNFGIFLFLSVLFGYFIGKWIDKWFDTKPVFTILWILFGVAAAIRELYRNVKKAMDPDKVMGEKKE